ncbi:MAG: hypothetical protein M0Z94_16040 [Dehalococcoidales bacterium]|nr:hypothetical protein [Dehalococcoidales bacterium]
MPGGCQAAPITARHHFTEKPEGFRVTRWLYARAWLTAEWPAVPFHLVTARLVERKVLHCWSRRLAPVRRHWTSCAECSRWSSSTARTAVT